MSSWQELESAALSIANPGRRRLEATGVALLGTLRKDGSPRISPVEPYFSQGQLVFGAMSWSPKARDLLREPRCVLHSAIAALNAGEPELKLYGHALEASPEIREGCDSAWWHARQADAAAVFALAIEQATLIEWDLERGKMNVRRWSSSEGLRETSRSYP